VRRRSGYAEIAAEMRAGSRPLALQATTSSGSKRWYKPEAIELYSNCRVFCCPSVYEPFGIINLEAMACALPSWRARWAEFWRLSSTARPATGAFDRIGDRIPGKWDRFARDLARRIAELMADPALCEKFGRAGRKRVEKTFAWRQSPRRPWNLPNLGEEIEVRTRDSAIEPRRLWAPTLLQIGLRDLRDVFLLLRGV